MMAVSFVVGFRSTERDEYVKYGKKILQRYIPRNEITGMYVAH